MLLLTGSNTITYTSEFCTHAHEWNEKPLLSLYIACKILMKVCADFPTPGSFAHNPMHTPKMKNLNALFSVCGWHWHEFIVRFQQHSQHQWVSTNTRCSRYLYTAEYMYGCFVCFIYACRHGYWHGELALSICNVPEIPMPRCSCHTKYIHGWFGFRNVRVWMCIVVLTLPCSCWQTPTPAPTPAPTRVSCTHALKCLPLKKRKNHPILSAMIDASPERLSHSCFYYNSSQMTIETHYRMMIQVASAHEWMPNVYKFMQVSVCNMNACLHVR